MRNVVYLEERNARNFVDCERMVLELKAIIFKSLYVWMVAYGSSCCSNFLEFLDLCSSTSQLGVSLVYLLCTWVAPLCVFY
jgi:hypothetical protein